ncbi:MAG: hypothetical protein Unbinned400contig1002_41 [Prokaryotic dsDNA virus sp.]|nr:MAG: hypothetical protein Unbinned400contig1002_41 [Prokaryotic dsDNA virus sp.]|tara:strand:- start:1224 stop:1427 length:204 start_codon:yes stop_codon:yes gene_type:complete
MSKYDAMDYNQILEDIFSDNIDAEFTPEGHPDGAFIDDERLDDSAGALDAYAYKRWLHRTYDIVDYI